MNNLTDSIAKPSLHTIAFYNTENLFDIYNNKNKFDEDMLPTANKRWTAKRYKNKLRKLGYAITNIGRAETRKHPEIIGLAEVENAKVIQDLIASKHLEACNYNFVHYNSPDERGIDVALLYDKTSFTVTSSETFSVSLFQDSGNPDYTRDILLVTGFLANTKIYIIVNHWSSRREGVKETEHKRIAASNKVGEIISNIKLQDANAKILIMGDFNDDPSSNSVKRLVAAYNLFNPMETIRSFSRGTTIHQRKWNLFDQIIFTSNFFEKTPNTLQYHTANIFDADFLKTLDGKYKGTPYRTYVGKKYKGGYSDHFPVYAIFKQTVT